MRLNVVDACSPLLLDAVIAGHDRDALGALLFLAPSAKQLPPDEARARLRAALEAHNLAHPSTNAR
ncbi:MAG TPA: hypothetical protein VF316_03075, partial [Polyangiaceae bacterium]